VFRLGQFAAGTIAIVVLCVAQQKQSLRHRPEPVVKPRILRFSPDGNYVLCQNRSEITLLTTRPFQVALRIPAVGASPSQFTPDSRELVFTSSVQRENSLGFQFGDGQPPVERWNLSDGTRVGWQSLPPFDCGTVALSPDGRILACDDFEGTLRIIDVASGETVYEKPKFVKPKWVLAGIPPASDERGIPPDQETDTMRVGELGRARLQFPPDGRLLVAMPDVGSTVIWELRERHLSRPTEALKALDIQGTTFTLLGRTASWCRTT